MWGGGGKPEERENLEDLDLDDRLILEWIKGGRSWIVGLWLGVSTNGDCFVRSNEHNECKFFE